MQQALGGGEVRRPRDRTPTGRVRGGLGDEQPGHPREVLGPLARRVDLEHAGDVGARERLTELAREQLRAGEQVRLEDRDDAARGERAGRGDRCAQLGRMMRVVIDDECARSRLPETLEAPSGAAEVRQRAGQLLRLGPGDDARCQRGRRVGDVVRPGTDSATACPAHTKHEPPALSSISEAP